MAPIAGLKEMESLEHKTIQTKPHDLTYSYYLSPNFRDKQSKDTPTLVFIHGYPDDAFMWTGAVPHFLKQPFPFVLVDLLGFGGSSKPTGSSKVSQYNYKQQANSIFQILDQEGVGNNVIPIGHDWGSATAQRTYLYHKHRCQGLIILSLAYQIPSAAPFDLNKANEVTAERFGYPQWEYWNFFTAPDAPKLMNADPMRMWEVNNGNFPSPKPEEKGRDIWMREMFCTPGTMREYVAKEGRYKDYTVDLKPYAQNKELQQRYLDRIKRDGFDAPVNYYHTLANNTMLKDEQELIDKPNQEGITIDVPMLFIGQTGDWVCRTDLMEDARKQGLLKGGCEDKVVDAGHWVLYEKPDEIAEVILEWLGRKFGGKS
ncbi:hypothetical protein B0A48_12075 [Cryoendolithus antarcticus]|uniref:AB hydrolase-1 domain-containing protein n=1 Tax=Cryoendolithus antarcticus TaxID=1507870 RepID=A0A1V8SU69_9PEZI|nr:hypothetical protein B0A48_12075 [Cryoendolithus antarcticus]